MRDFIQIVYLSICLAFLITQWSFADDASESLPQTWYELPEDSGRMQFNLYDEKTRWELSEGAERAIERIFEVNASALEKAHDYRARDSR